MGPFGTCAEAYTAAGLCIIPCGGEHGKRPLVVFKHVRRPWKPEHLETLLKRHEDSNVGILTGPSHLTVVDIDDAALADEMETTFGPTPIKVRTPRGGLHLWYRGGIVRSTNLRPRFAVDIKSKSGLVIAPPSLSPTGVYEFVAQKLDALSQLPLFRTDALRAATSRKSAPLNRFSREVRVGERNDVLFLRALRHARGADDFETLMDAVCSDNDRFPIPLDEAEVRKVACSAWRYEQEGLNWSGQEATAIIPRTEYDSLADKTNALQLWLMLQYEHRLRPNFSISPHAMARANVIPGWSHIRIANARDVLLERGLIDRIHRGGSRPGDADVFVFGRRVKIPDRI